MTAVYVCHSLCHAAELSGRRVQGSFDAGFAKSLWLFVFIILVLTKLCCCCCFVDLQGIRVHTRADAILRRERENGDIIHV